MTPAGKPVSEALALTEEAETLRTASRAVDAVHGDGDLPVIPVSLRPGAEPAGVYYSDSMDRPLRIEIGAAGRYPELTHVHEIGHFLDQMALGKPHQWATSVLPDDMEEWRKAVRESGAVSAMREAYRTAPLTQDERDAIRNLLRPRELWARSYAQYVAIRSGEPILLEQVGKARSLRMPNTEVVLQWDEDDFAPIVAAIDHLFQAKGWRR
jgi:hypothetical protein